MTPRRRVSITLLLTLFLILTGCDAGSESLVDVPEQDVTPTVEVERSIGDGATEEGFGGTLAVSNQATDGTSVTIEEATVDPGSGWVAVYLDQQGGLGKAIGWARLGLAGSGPVQVQLDQAVASSTTLWAQLHADAEPVGEFNWPGVDEPVTGADGEPIHQSFEVSIEEG